MPYSSRFYHRLINYSCLRRSLPGALLSFSAKESKQRKLPAVISHRPATGSSNSCKHNANRRTHTKTAGYTQSECIHMFTVRTVAVVQENPFLHHGKDTKAIRCSLVYSVAHRTM